MPRRAMNTRDEENEGSRTGKEQLQRLQDFFCRANDMYLTCLDGSGALVTQAYGSEEELGYIRRIVDEIDYRQLVRRAGADPVENIQEKAMDEPYVRLCGVAARMDGDVTLIWVAFALLGEQITEHDEVPEYMARTTQERFYRSVELLEMLSRQLLEVKANERAAWAAMRASDASAAKTERSLHRSDSMTRVMHALDSEQAFDAVVEQILRETCGALGIAGSCMIRVGGDGEAAEMVCEYTKTAQEAGRRLAARTAGELPFYDGKSYMLSASSVKPSAFVRLFEDCGIGAAVFQPVQAGGGLSYLCFYETENRREWSVPDIRFINGVRRVVQSILTKRLAKQQVASSLAALEAVLENAGCGIYVVDYRSRQTLYTNRRFNELFASAVAAGQIEELLLSEEEEKRPHYYGDIYVPQEERWLEVRKTEIRWADGRMVNLCTLCDITEQKAGGNGGNCGGNAFLEGLSGRMQCEQELGHCLVQAQSAEGEGALLYLKLEDFRQAADRPYRDALIQATEHSLSCIRGLSRSYYIGEAVFLILVPDGEYEELERIVAEIGALFINPWSLKGEDYYCSMSMGIARFPSDGDSAPELIRRAERACLQAKKRGKNCVEYYRETGGQSEHQRLELEKKMRTAALNACSEFEVYYQPIVRAAQGTPCCGAEALVRWNSGTLGTAGPNDFLPLAEYLGLISPVGRYVLKKAAKRCRHWNDSGHPDYGVTVSLSMVQFMHRDIVKLVRGVLRETKLLPENLTLGVEESSKVKDLVRLKRVISELRSLGVKIVLNDFGAGGTVSHIRELPLDGIRIDRTFSGHLGEDDFSDAFVRMAPELASSAGLAVGVNGIETVNQKELAAAMGAGWMQGDYFGRPMTAEAFETKYL